MCQSCKTKVKLWMFVLQSLYVVVQVGCQPDDMKALRPSKISSHNNKDVSFPFKKVKAVCKVKCWSGKT